MSAALAKAVARVKDDPQFLASIEQIAERYSREHAADISRPTPAQTRQALREFEHLALTLQTWLQNAAPVDSVTRPEQDAALKMGATVSGAPSLTAMLAWCAQAQVSARAAYAAYELKGKMTRYFRSAPRIAAYTLRELYKLHGLQFSGYRKGPTVTLLRAIAVTAGDRSLTVEAAKAHIAEALKPVAEPLNRR